MPDGVTIGNKTGDLPPGIHVRGAGGYIIAAPSFNTKGQYQWVEIRPIAPLPDVLLQILASPPPPPPRPGGPMVQRRSGFILTGTPLYEGERNNGLIRVAGAMRGKYGMGVEEIRDLLPLVNDNRCQPPLDAGEVDTIAWSAGRWPAGGPMPAAESAPRSDRCSCGHLFVILGTGERRCGPCGTTHP